MRILVYAILCCMLGATAWGQTAYKRFYVSMADVDVLSFYGTLDQQRVKPFFKADSINQVAAPYEVVTFRQSFPGSSHEEMLRVWTIESDVIDSLALAERLHLLYPHIFLLIEEDLAGCNCPKRN